MAYYDRDRRQLARLWNNGTDTNQYIQQSFANFLPLLQNADVPVWLELHLNQPPTNPNLICIGEVDGTVYYCHPDDEDRLRIGLNLPKPE